MAAGDGRRRRVEGHAHVCVLLMMMAVGRAGVLHACSQHGHGAAAC